MPLYLITQSLIIGGGFTAPLGSNDDIWMITLGTAPNRQLWIMNFSYAYESQSYSYNFVVLEETSNKIYVLDTRWATQGVGSYTVGVQQDGVTAVQHANSPNIFSLNPNVAPNWDPATVQRYEFTPFIPSSEDTYLASIDAPIIPACSASGNVEVTFGSFGSNPLTSLEIGWSVNGVVQAPFNWTGTVSQFSTQSNVIIGSYTFSDGDILKVWTANPNMTTDGDNLNDTLEVNVDFGLSGTYTIGTTGDYSTFTDAVNDVINLGVCGSVIFDVQSGTYTEQFVLPEVANMNALNTVTFKSLSGDSTDVELQFAGTGAADNFVVHFDGGDYFTFENMTLHNTTTAGNGRVLDVEGVSEHNTFKNCLLVGDTNSTSTSTLLSVVYSASGDADSYWTFENNRIIGGSYGVYWYGQSTTPYQEVGTQFIDNSFELNYYRGARLYYQEAPIFSGNTASYDTGYGTGLDVFYFGYCDSALTVTNNYVHLDGLYGDGIYIYYCEGSASQFATVSNNQVIINTPAIGTAVSGIYSSNSDFAKFYHNSIYIDNTSTSSEGIYNSAGIQNVIVNNSIVNNGPGYGVYYIGTSVGTSDHNNIYAPNGSVGYLGGALATLNDWQLGSGMDAMSISVDPSYAAIDDLHTCSADLDNAGMGGIAITTDIDGQTRDTNTPDIGVDEYFTPSFNFLGPDTSKCIGVDINIGGNFSAPGGTYLWSESSTTAAINVTTPGEYSVAITGTCGVAEDTIQVTDIPLPIANFTQANSFLTAILTDASTAATAWSWDFGDGNTSTLQNPIHVYSTPGTYTVTLTVIGECGTNVTSQDFEASTVGIDENHFSDLKIFPNPTDNLLNVQFSAENTNTVTIQITDLSGKVVKTDNASVLDGLNTYTLSVSDLNSGIYLISIVSQQGMTIRKFEVR